MRGLLDVRKSTGDAMTAAVQAPRLTAFPATFGNVPGLDGMRALSILAVVASHLVTGAIPGGHGVFLFFIISGFLITRLLFAEAKKAGLVDLPQFYLRRVFRLYPVILVYVAVVCAVYAWRGPIDWMEPLAALFYFSNYLVAHRNLTGGDFQMPFQIFWSLSVEEHFYLVFPLLFAALLSPVRIAWLAVATCVAVLGLRVGAAALNPEIVGTHFLYMRTEFRIDSIAFGVLLAALCELPRAHRWLRLVCHPVAFCLAILIGLASIAVGNDWFANVLRYSILGPAIMVVMTGLIFGSYPPLQWLLALPPMEWIGKLSYSLYVWHIPAGMIAGAMVGGLPGIALALVLALAISAVSYYGVEQPMIKVRKRFGSHVRS